jgi:autophagy-related protein 17
MGHAYDRGAREFQQLLVTLDAANEKLEQTMRMLRETRVEPVFRPPNEEAKCLMDFVDENSVEGMRDALKGSIAELQVSADAWHSCRTLAHCSTGCPHIL